jgi:hypothetical protein
MTKTQAIVHSKPQPSFLSIQINNKITTSTTNWGTRSSILVFFSILSFIIVKQKCAYREVFLLLLLMVKEDNKYKGEHQSHFISS